MLRRDYGVNFTDDTHRAPDGTGICVETSSRARRHQPPCPDERLEQYESTNEGSLAADAAAHAERLRLASDAGQMGLWDWDLCTNQLIWNACEFELLGLVPEDGPVDARRFYEPIHPEEASRVRRLIQEAIEHGDDLHSEYRVIRKDGEVRWLSVTAHVYRDESGRPSHLAGVNFDVTERKHAEQAMISERDQLEANLADMRWLHRISSRLVGQEDITVLLEEILVALLAIARADIGNIKLLDHESGALRLKAHRGVARPFGEYCARAGASPACCCGAALEANRRIVVPNIERSEFYAGKRRGESLIKLGIRAVQSTPLVSRSGQTLGVMSAHWRRPHHPGGRELRLIELLSRQTADLIQRHQCEVTLRKRERALRQRLERLKQRVRDRTAIAERRARDLRQLTARLGDAEHRERQRLSRILHDELQQLFLAARLRLADIGRTEGERVRTELEAVDGILDECMQTSRDLIAELSPPILRQGALGEVFQWLGELFAEKYGLRVAVDAQEGLPPVSSSTRLLLFQAVRELLINVVKHSGVMEARVLLSLDDGSLTVRVEDGGRDFDGDAVKEKLRRARSFGLLSIRERLEAIEGRLEIDRSLAGGGCFRLIVPRKAVEESQTRSNTTER